MRISSNKTNKMKIIDENENNLNNNSQNINKEKQPNNNIINFQNNISTSEISKEKLQNLKYIFPF